MSRPPIPPPNPLLMATVDGDPAVPLNGPRTAPAADRPCELHQYHSPVVVRTQLHHSRPVYLQNRVYGRIVYPGDTWLCGTDHDSLHEVIDWLLSEGRQPNPMPGSKTLAEARRTVQWYRDAMGETA